MLSVASPTELLALLCFVSPFFVPFVKTSHSLNMSEQAPFLVVFTEGGCLSDLVHWSEARDVAVLRCVHSQFRQAHTFLIAIRLSGWNYEHHRSLTRIQKLHVFSERRPDVLMTGLDSLRCLREVTLVRVSVSLYFLSPSVKQLTLRSCEIRPGSLNPAIRLDALDCQYCTVDRVFGSGSGIGPGIGPGYINQVMMKEHLGVARFISVYAIKLDPELLERIGASLVTLEVGWTQLTDLPQALVQCVNLETLKLPFNRLGQGGQRRLVEAVRYMNRLTLIDLTGCYTGDNRDIVQALGPMTHVHLGENQLTDLSAPALAALISRSPTLETLYVPGNSGLGDEGVGAIATALASRRQLRAISFVGCGVSSVGRYSLRLAVPDLREYGSLYFSTVT